MEAFAGLSRKAAGSQGRALSRAPQSAESPFDSGQGPESTKMKRKAPPAGGKILLRLKAAHEPRSQWNGVLFMYILVDFPSREIGKIKKGFRRLWTAKALFQKARAKTSIMGTVPILTMKKPLCTDREVSRFFQISFRKLALRDSTYRASTSAGTAVNASVSVDYVLAVTLGDCAYRALTCAGTAADASARNYVCHGNSTSNSNYILILS